MNHLNVEFRKYYLMEKNSPNDKEASIIEEEHLTRKRIRRSMLAKVSGWRMTVVGRLIKKAKSEAETHSPLIFQVTEEWAFRLALAMRAASFTRLRDVAESLVEAVSSMPKEEVYFWHSKAVALGFPRATRALRALYSRSFGGR